MQRAILIFRGSVEALLTAVRFWRLEAFGDELWPVAVGLAPEACIAGGRELSRFDLRPVWDEATFLVDNLALHVKVAALALSFQRHQVDCLRQDFLFDGPLHGCGNLLRRLLRAGLEELGRTLQHHGVAIARRRSAPVSLVHNIF